MKGTRLTWLLSTLALGTLLLAGCGKLPQSVVDPAGPVAQMQLGLLEFDLWMIAWIGAAVIFVILFAISKFRRRPAGEAVPPQWDSNRRLEIGWTLGAVALLIPLAIHPISGEFALANPPADPNTVEIKVIGHQWWWEFQYPKEKITAANEVHIPTGRVIRFKVTSVDVIHSFWVPRLGGKMDANPGRVTDLWLKADEPGVYYGQCAELCGPSHGRMLFRVIAHSPGDYDAWVNSRKNANNKAQDTLAQNGEKIFGQRCRTCHTIDGTAYQGRVGPNLTAYGYQQTIGGGIMENTNETLAAWISNPQSVKPGTKMPNLQLKKDEVDSLVAFLKGLK